MPVDPKVLEDLVTDPEIPVRTRPKVPGEYVKIILYPPGTMRNTEKERAYILKTTDVQTIQKMLCAAGLCINHTGADASVRPHDGSYVAYSVPLKVDELPDAVKRWVEDRLKATKGTSPAANERSLYCNQCKKLRA